MNRAPRMTPEQRKAVLDFCLERQQSGDRDPQQAYQIAREIHGIEMKYSSFETGPWRDARAELKRRWRLGGGKEPEAIDIPPPVVKPRVDPDDSETVIRSRLGRFRSVPSGGGYDVEFHARVDRNTHMNLMGTAYAILCPAEGR